ncbi:MAG: hypothetical protein Tsb008_06990 [Rhodothalassiaceae bacterium]
MADDFLRIHGYWRSLAPHGGVPERSKFDPNKLRDLLPKIVIIGRDREKRALCRLMGSYCVDRFGANLTGRDLSSMMGPKAAALLEEAVSVSCREGDGLVLHLRIKAPQRNARASQLLLLPMRAGASCQMLGALAPSLDLPANSLPNAQGRADRLILEGIRIFDGESAEIGPFADPEISFAD